MAQQTTTDIRPAGGHSLVTGQGKTSIADSVVSKIAGVAAREVSGVHEMGRGAARAFGTIKEKLPGTSGPSVTQGVSVEVGERQAAVDLADTDVAAPGQVGGHLAEASSGEVGDERRAQGGRGARLEVGHHWTRGGSGSLSSPR